MSHHTYANEQAIGAAMDLDTAIDLARTLTNQKRQEAVVSG